MKNVIEKDFAGDQDKDTILKDIQTTDETKQVEDAIDRERWRNLWQTALVLNGS